MSLRPFEVLRNKKLAEYRDHPVLFTDIGFDEWKRLSREKRVPVGAVWVAALATVYGPLEKSDA